MTFFFVGCFFVSFFEFPFLCDFVDSFALGSTENRSGLMVFDDGGGDGAKTAAAIGIACVGTSASVEMQLVWKMKLAIPMRGEQ